MVNTNSVMLFRLIDSMKERDNLLSDTDRLLPKATIEGKRQEAGKEKDRPEEKINNTERMDCYLKSLINRLYIFCSV